MSLRSARTLKDQLFIPPRGQKWRGLPSSASVKNMGMNKPLGGFWTSTYRGGRSDWADWATVNLERKKATQGILLEPGGKVYHLDDQSDYDRLFAKFPRKGMFDEDFIDWEAVSRAYDGVHISRQGIRNLASLGSTNNDPPLYGWDVESTVWFNPSVLMAKGVIKMGASASRVANRFLVT